MVVPGCSWRAETVRVSACADVAWRCPGYARLRRAHPRMRRRRVEMPWVRAPPAGASPHAQASHGDALGARLRRARLRMCGRRARMQRCDPSRERGHLALSRPARAGRPHSVANRADGKRTPVYRASCSTRFDIRPESNRVSLRLSRLSRYPHRV
jgi:hypothetical protein